MCVLTPYHGLGDGLGLGHGLGLATGDGQGLATGDRVLHGDGEGLATTHGDGEGLLTGEGLLVHTQTSTHKHAQTSDTPSYSEQAIYAR